MKKSKLKLTRITIVFLITSLIGFGLYLKTLVNLSYRGVSANAVNKAFPGAEGFGSATIGGRGGQVISVTNTNDSGEGSFRNAVDASGPRIIIFKTGGRIHLNTPININNPFVTIAGQTAPGDGIAISGAPLTVQTHDVIIRGLKFRIGDLDGYDPGNRDGLKVSGFDTKDAYNIILDHNSISWAVDENGSTWDNSTFQNKVRDITFSWNIFSEGLYCSTHDVEPTTCSSSPIRYPHSMGLIIGKNNKNISLHHNLFASNGDRNPYISGGTTTEIINNVIYNWRSYPTHISDNGANAPMFSNLIGNYYKSTSGSSTSRLSIYLKCNILASSKLYIRGNIGPGRSLETIDDWGLVSTDSGCDISALRANSSALAVESGTTKTSAQDAYNSVLDKAGAYIPVRDNVDIRAINNTRNGTSPVSGKWLVDSQTEVGGWPTYNPGIYPTDNDYDGIPDSWENDRGGNLNPSDVSASGYTWIEEYINSFFTPSTVTITPSPDTQYPTIVINSPNSGSRVNKNKKVNISASATDNVAVTRVDFVISAPNYSFICTDTTATYTCAWIVPNSSGITYTITATATDSSGNSSASSVNVTSR